MDEKDEISAKLKEFLERFSTEGVGLVVDLAMKSLGPEEGVLLRLCAIPHDFDQAILRVLSPGLDEAERVYKKFAALPFVSHCPGGLRLTEDVRRPMFQEWLGPPARPEFREASERLFRHFDGLAREDEVGEDAALNRRMFHLLGFDLKAGFAEFEKLFRLSRHDFSLTRCEQLIKLAREYDAALPAPDRHRLTYQEGKLAADRHQLERAEGIFNSLLRAEDLDELLRIKTSNRLGMVYARAGRWEDARGQYTTAGEMAEHVEGAERLLPVIVHDLGVTYRETGDLDRAETLLTWSATEANKSGDLPMLAASLNSLGNLYRKYRDFKNAKTYYLKSLDCLRELGDKFRISQLYNNLAVAYLDSSDWQSSEDYLNDSLAIKREVGDIVGEARTLNNLARVYVRGGDIGRAVDTARMAVGKFEKVHDYRDMAYAQWNLGRLCKRAGRDDEWRTALDGAAKTFERSRLFTEAKNVRQEMTRL